MRLVLVGAWMPLCFYGEALLVFVILNAVKNLVPQHPSSTFLTPTQPQEKEATLG